MDARALFLAWLTERGGVAHTSDARAAGHAEAVVAACVAGGRVRRVRRSWLATRDCDPSRLAAASVSGRVTCVSAARLLGLRTPVHDGVHIAVRANSSRFDPDGLVVHWSPGPAPVGRNEVVDPVLNVLFHTARCLPRSEALAVWESAVRLRHVDPRMLVRTAWRSRSAVALAGVASDLSDSGVETRFVYGMTQAGIAVRQQIWIDGHPVDGLIGERLVVQIDGFEHHRTARDRRRDIQADARLALLGYTVLRFDYQQVFFEWEFVLTTIRTAMAQGLHRVPGGPHRLGSGDSAGSGRNVDRPA